MLLFILPYRFKKHLESNSSIDVLPTEEYSKVMQIVDAIPPGMTSDDLDPTVITTAPPGRFKKSFILTFILQK